jgi:hypothetical protein
VTIADSCRNCYRGILDPPGRVGGGGGGGGRGGMGGNQIPTGPITNGAPQGRGGGFGRGGMNTGVGNMGMTGMANPILGMNPMIGMMGRGMANPMMMGNMGYVT